MIFGCKSSRIRARNAAGTAALLSATNDPTETLFRHMLTLHQHVHDFDPIWGRSPASSYGLDFHDDDNFLDSEHSSTEEPVLLHPDLQRMARELAEQTPIVMPDYPPSPQPNSTFMPAFPFVLDTDETRVPYLQSRTRATKRKRQVIFC
jgi:hypothetical protein